MPAYSVVLGSSLTDCFSKIASLQALGTDTTGKRVLVVPTAAIGEGWLPNEARDGDDWAEAYLPLVRPFETYGDGFTVDVLDLAAVDGPLPEDYLAPYKAVYVSGGNTFHLMKHIRASGFEAPLKRALANGLVYVGTSAGAVAAGPDIAYAASVDDPGMGDGKTGGLGIVDFAVLPHYDSPDFAEAVHAIHRDWDWSDLEPCPVSETGLVFVTANGRRGHWDRQDLAKDILQETRIPGR